MEPKPQSKSKNQFKKEDIAGLAFGISLVWSLGLSGFIPYILGIALGVGLTRKILNSKNKYIKIIFWILLIVLFLYGSAVRGTRMNPNYTYQNTTTKPAVVEDNFENQVDEIAYNNFLSSSEKYLIKDVGSISIPTNMEIQTDYWKKLSDILDKEMAKKFDYEISGNKVIFQQKGLNDLDPSSLNTYVRMIIETSIDNVGDYNKLTTELLVTQNELNELSELLEAQFEQSFKNTDLKIIKWHGVSIETINGRSVLKISYLRQLDDNPYVYVTLYQFHNNDRMHQLTFSYREEDKDIWEKPFKYVLNSFTITNVR